jgi:tetratricopeptide (TPR) repeat protein
LTPAKERLAMRRFNTRLFLWLLGTAAVLTGVVFLVHWLQTGRIASALLWQAHRAEEQGHPEQTARYLSRYLDFVPDDHERRGELGKVLGNLVVSGDKGKVSYRTRQQALFVLEQVVARDPSLHDMRKLLARVAMDLGRPEVALEHLNQLHADLPEDGEVDALLAQCHESQEHYADAALLYWEATRQAPKDRDSYVRLAALLRRPDRAQWRLTGKDPEQVLKKDPEEVLGLLVSRNGGDWRAFLDRWHQHNPLEMKDPKKRAEAGHDVEEALRLAPEEVDVLLAAAELARAGGQFDEARAYLRKGCGLHADDERLYLALSDLDFAQGKPREAVERIQEGLKALPDRPNLLWMLANLQVDTGEREKAEQTIAKLTKTDLAASGLAYLRARVLLLQGRWSEAAGLLENTRPTMEHDRAEPGMLNQVDLYLAECYERLDEPQQRLAVYDRLIARETKRDQASPALLTALQGRAATLWALGHLDEAVTQQQDLMTRPGAPPAGWAEVARLLLARNLLKGNRSWKDVGAALDQAEKAQPKAVEVPLLRARVLIARQEFDRAGAVLEAARKNFPDRVEPWTALAALAQLQKKPARAAQILKDAEADRGDSIELRLAKARLWAAKADRKDNEPFPTGLGEGLDKLNPTAEEQTRLLRGLVESAYAAGKVGDAVALWGRLAEMPSHQHDVRIKMVLFDLALEANDRAALDRAVEGIRHAEGGQGPLSSYAEAMRLLRAEKPEPAALDRAGALLDTAAQRKGWPAVRLAQAELARLKNNPDQAIDYYQKAVELNERSPEVIRQLARLLDQRGRGKEADNLLKNLSPEVMAGSDMQWLAADIALRQQDPARALELASAAVRKDSKDYRDYLRRGAVLAANGKQAEAGVDLRRAVELAPEQPEPRLALVQFLARTGRADEAREELKKAGAEVPKDQSALTLAEGYEVLGDVDRAREQYGRAVKERPEDYAVRKKAAGFAMRAGPLPAAEALLRPVVVGQVKAPDADAAWARRGLALVLSANPDEPHFAEALALVGLRLDGGKIVAAEKAPALAGEELAREQRAQAEVLASRPQRAYRTAAIARLEDLGKHGTATPDDQFLLAKLYDQDGATTKAGDLLLRLVADNPNNASYLGYYGQKMFREHQWDKAETAAGQLAQLEKKRELPPGSLGSVELQAQVLEQRDEGKKALALLRGYANRKGARPEDAILVIASLARQKQFDAALAACEEAWKTCPPEDIGSASLAVLRAMKPTTEQCRPIERHLKEAQKKDPRSTAFLLLLADLYDLQGNYTEAKKAYRDVLALEEGNVVALNNLAWLLAETSDNADQGLDLIQRAIKLQGERAELLDTRAAVALVKGQTDSAIKDLERANADSPSPSRYVRLALAYLQAKDREAALAAFNRAKSSGLKPEQLHPIEQTALRKVASELEPH